MRLRVRVLVRVRVRVHVYVCVSSWLFNYHSQNLIGDLCEHLTACLH